MDESTAEQRARYEQQQLSTRGMRLLTGGLTDQGDAFLIAVGAVAVMATLYPLIGAWALLAFPVVFIGAVVARRQLRRRRKTGSPGPAKDG
jgi:membrane protein implicated in regulation of membrane protease activity